MSDLSCLSKLKILYVEDDAQTRLHTLEMFENFFFDIAVGVDGRDGLDKFKKSAYDAIFTDLDMPNMDGLKMIENIRSFNSNVPIFIFSAHDDAEHFLKCIHYGIDGYLLKPFDMRELQKIVAKLANKAQTALTQNGNIVSLVEGFYWDIINEKLYQYEKNIMLTKNEILLFNLLASSKSRIFPAIDIEIAIFDDDKNDTFRVRNLLSRLKKKLQTDLIESIYGNGYRLK